MEIGHAEGADSQTMRRLGTRLAGKWCLVRLLGVGGMAAVYEARHTTGRRVAIKMMHAHHKGNARLHKRFVREAYVANSLAHPAVVPVYDVDVHDDGTPYLIMDLLMGQSVEVLCRGEGGKLAPERVSEIAEVVLEVLVEAHGKGIVHRDLKPANLFITKQGELKVLDFGIAKGAQLSPAFTAATRYGSLLGTPAFMSPEQACGQWDAVDHQSDLWSLGATLFRLLTGRAVHEATNINEQWALAMRAPAPKVRDLSPELPERLATVIDGALSFAKSERWPNAAHMYRMLTGRDAPALSSAEELAHEELSTLSRTLTLKAPASSSGQLGRRRSVLALSAAGLMALAVATASQRNASSRRPADRPVPTPTQFSVERSDPDVHRVAAQPALATHPGSDGEARPVAWTPKNPLPGADHVPEDSARRSETPPGLPGSESALPRGRAARPSSPLPATPRAPSPTKKKVEPERPTTSAEPEFGALLDVWE